MICTKRFFSIQLYVCNIGNLHTHVVTIKPHLVLLDTSKVQEVTLLQDDTFKLDLKANKVKLKKKPQGLILGSKSCQYMMYVILTVIYRKKKYENLKRWMIQYFFF